MSAKAKIKASTALLGHNPLDGEQLLLDALYGAPVRASPAQAEPLAPAAGLPKAVLAPRPAEDGPDHGRAPERPPRPQHYKIISISLYNEDIERLERLVEELKRRGHHKANKSQIIREALARLDLEAVAPRSKSA